MNTAGWLAAVRKLREEVLKKYTKYDTPAWNIKFSSNFLNLAEMSAKDLGEAQRVRARSSSAPLPGPLHGTEATARRNREGTVATLLRSELAALNAHEDGNNLTTNAYRNKVCTNPWKLCNSRVPVDCSKNLFATWGGPVGSFQRSGCWSCNARVLEQSNGMPFRWKCTATWAHPYSFAFLDEYVHSPKSRSLAFLIELRVEVDHMNIMS